MPTIQILQKDQDSGVLESYIVDALAIAELHCRYPIPSNEVSEDETEGETPPEPQTGSIVEPDLDILYMNGEHTVISLTVPTSFLLFLEGGKMVCKTTRLQEFETAYLNAIVQGHKAESSE